MARDGSKKGGARGQANEKTINSDLLFAAFGGRGEKRAKSIVQRVVRRSLSSRTHRRLVELELPRDTPVNVDTRWEIIDHATLSLRYFIVAIVTSDTCVSPNCVT